MNISIVIVAGAIVILLIALMMMIARMAATRKPRRTGKPSSRPAQEAKASTRWRAVRISPGLICCDAVREHDEQVFLSSESPMLPVDGCDVADCRCKYIHLEDRRTGSDRRAQLDELNAFLPFNQVDRRRTPSRRFTDLVD